MAHKGSSLNVRLDATHAAKLRRLAERSGADEAVLAQSLLAHALDGTDTDPAHVADALDAIPGAYERAQLGRSQARESEGVTLDDL